MLIDETTFTFEPDEEGGYRALVAGGKPFAENPGTIRLLLVIAEKLAKLSV